MGKARGRDRLAARACRTGKKRQVCYNVLMKSTVAFLLFALLVVGLLYAVSGKRYSQVPDDASHNNVALADTPACLVCHGPGKKDALKAEHPPKYECYKCHKAKRIRR